MGFSKVAIDVGVERFLREVVDLRDGRCDLTRTLDLTFTLYLPNTFHIPDIVYLFACS
jgi:hypothetical protein